MESREEHAKRMGKEAQIERDKAKRRTGMTGTGAYSERG